MSGDAHALWFVEPHRAEIRPEPAKEPGPGEIGLEAIVSLVSQGSEMRFYRGNSGATQLSVPTMSGTMPFPIKYGYQVIARVVDPGDCEGYAVGDRVFAVHPHQDRFTMRGEWGAKELTFPLLTVLPPAISDRQAAFLNMYAVALNCLLDVAARPGECVAVSGLGLIGSFCAHLARQNASRLILIDPQPLRREIAAWIGADAVVAPEDAREVVAEMTDGRGVDVFYEASGAPAALQQAIDHTGLQGTVAIPSFYGSEPVTVSLAEYHRKRLKLISSFMGVMGAGPLWSRRRTLEVAAEGLSRIDVDAMVTHALPFMRAPEAYDIVDRQAASTLAVLLDYGA